MSFTPEKLHEDLQKLCDFSTLDVASYILSIENRPELEEYLFGTLGDSPAVRDLIQRLSKRFASVAKTPAPQPVEKPTSTLVAPTGTRLYRKNDDADDEFSALKSTSKQKKKQKASDEVQGEEVVRAPPGFLSGLTVKYVHGDKSAPKGDEPGSGAASEEDEGLKRALVASKATGGSGGGPPGTLADSERHCACQATLHKLLCNCMGCGKLICEREAGHTCTFCGAVLSISGMGKKAIDKARRRAQLQSQEHLQAMGLTEDQAADEALQRAIAHKDKLLMFDKTSAQRSVVLDDQADYFADASAVWMSDKERTEAQTADTARRDERHNVRAKVKLSFDFTGRKVAVTDSTEQVRAGQAFGKQIGKKFAEADDDVPVKPTATTSGLKPSPLPPPKPLPNKPTSSTKPSTMTAATQKLIAEGLYLGAGAGAGPFTNTVCGSDHNNDAFLPNNTLTGRASSVYESIMAERGNTSRTARNEQGWLSSRVQHTFDVDSDALMDALLLDENGDVSEDDVSGADKGAMYPDKNTDDWWDFPGFG